MNTAARRHGFTLLEILAVLAGLTVMMTVSTYTLLHAFQIQNTARDSLERQKARMGLFDQFRADVASAAALPESWGDVHADASCLILRKPDGKHVVYRVEKSRLQRWERNTAEGVPVWVEFQPLGIAAEFQRAGPEGRLVTLRLTQMTGRGASKRPIHVTAALGGDLQ